MSIDTEGYVCWVNEEERVLSFHQEPGYEKKEFRDKEDFQSFYMTLTSSGYNVTKVKYGGKLDIPVGGMVISGHGDASKWVHDNIKVGATVTFDGRIVKVK